MNNRLARPLLTHRTRMRIPSPSHVRRVPARDATQRGFTLIELMTVVIILGVLATVAIGAYSRHVRNAHKTEVLGDLSNLTLKQKTFRSVHGHYASTAECEGPGCTYPEASLIQTVEEPYPWDITDTEYTLEGVTESAFFRGGGAVHGFDALRFLPENAQSWCGYATVSGWGSTDLDDATGVPTNIDGELVDELFPGGSEPYYARDWFFSYALCDFDFDGEYWAFTAAHYDDDVNFNDSALGTYRENE